MYGIWGHFEIDR